MPNNLLPAGQGKVLCDEDPVCELCNALHDKLLPLMPQHCDGGFPAEDVPRQASVMPVVAVVAPCKGACQQLQSSDSAIHLP